MNILTVERGERNLSIKSLKRITDALKVKISEIFSQCGE
jgi:transcriptional regulator with XRE-family HTH domain